MVAYYRAMNSICGYRTLCDHLIGNSMLLRGNERRQIELADIAISDIRGGRSKNTVMTVLLNNGKTNQVGRTEYGCAFRHKNVEGCCISATLLYLFLTLRNSVPDTTNLERFLNHKLFHTEEDVTESISYNTHAAPVRKCLKALNIISSKVTHIERGSAVRHAVRTPRVRSLRPDRRRCCPRRRTRPGSDGPTTTVG